MKIIITNTPLPKPSLLSSLCLTSKIPSFTHNHTQKPTHTPTTTCRYASIRTPVSGRRTHYPNPSPTSLYPRPTLAQIKQNSTAARARVYEFLCFVGIVPDELDGLELPVIVDVMRERVDLLHSLGLAISDINSYHVLDCSVKKNMIPVLDFLGSLGVRKSSLADFLCRYPMVLHSSVVVDHPMVLHSSIVADLKLVVKYLEGMDIKPKDISRVLERYPELLGFKLEGTMRTSVAYLIGIGVGRRELGGVLARRVAHPVPGDSRDAGWKNYQAFR